MARTKQTARKNSSNGRAPRMSHAAKANGTKSKATIASDVPHQIVHSSIVPVVPPTVDTHHDPLPQSISFIPVNDLLATIFDEYILVPKGSTQPIKLNDLMDRFQLYNVTLFGSISIAKPIEKKSTKVVLEKPLKESPNESPKKIYNIISKRRTFAHTPKGIDSFKLLSDLGDEYGVVLDPYKIDKKFDQQDFETWGPYLTDTISQDDSDTISEEPEKNEHEPIGTIVVGVIQEQLLPLASRDPIDRYLANHSQFMDSSDDIEDKINLLTIESDNDSTEVKSINSENEVQSQYATIHIGINSNHNYKKGDIIKLCEDGYRNEDTFIWDGSNIMALDNNIDDYGALPSQFTYPEFPLNYWDNSISHNYIRWVDDTIKSEILQNYNCQDDTSFFFDNGKKIVLETDVDQSLLDTLHSSKYYVESTDDSTWDVLYVSPVV